MDGSGKTIGIGALALDDRPGVGQSGVARYVAELTAALGAVTGEERYIVYGRREGRGRAPVGMAWREAWWSAGSPAARLAWEQTGLVLQARRDRLDLFHGPVNVVPEGMLGAAVVTIHDLAFLTLGGHAPGRRVAYFRATVGRSARRARLILTPSQVTAADVAARFGVDPARIRVTPLGVRGGLRPLASGERDAFRARQGWSGPVLLYAGNLEPRKNLPALVRAFDRIAGETGATLVLGGAEGWMPQELRDALAAMRHREAVRLPGFLPEADLGRWLGAADLFVFPSRYEGFGLPPLEAMACGTPVVASTAGALPETLGDAALLVASDDVAALAAAIGRVLGDGALAAELRARGLARAARYTWAETARLTRAAYLEALA